MHHVFVLWQAYVKRQILALAGSISLSRRLNLPSETIVQAFADIFEQHQRQQHQQQDGEHGGPTLQLLFRHECL